MNAAVIETVNGDIVITVTLSSDILIAKLSVEGILLWSRLLGEQQGDEKSYSVSEMDNGHLAVVGTTIREGSSVLLALLDEQGNIANCNEMRTVYLSVRIPSITAVPITPTIQSPFVTMQDWDVREGLQPLTPMQSYQCGFSTPVMTTAFDLTTGRSLTTDISQTTFDTTTTTVSLSSSPIQNNDKQVILILATALALIDCVGISALVFIMCQRARSRNSKSSLLQLDPMLNNPVDAEELVSPNEEQISLMGNPHLFFHPAQRDIQQSIVDLSEVENKRLKLK